MPGRRRVFAPRPAGCVGCAYTAQDRRSPPDPSPRKPLVCLHFRVFKRRNASARLTYYPKIAQHPPEHVWQPGIHLRRAHVVSRRVAHALGIVRGGIYSPGVVAACDRID